MEPRKASEDDENSKKTRSEASLRGSLTKELSETDKKRLDEEEEKLNEKAKLQREDYQLSYAIDLLRGFSVLQQKNARFCCLHASRAILSMASPSGRGDVFDDCW